MGALVLVLVIALVWLFRQILTAPLLASCDDSACCCRSGAPCNGACEFCGAAPDEPCSVTFHVEP